MRGGLQEKAKWDQWYDRHCCRAFLPSICLHLLIEDFCLCRGLLDKVGNPEQRSVKKITIKMNLYLCQVILIRSNGPWFQGMTGPPGVAGPQGPPGHNVCSQLHPPCLQFLQFLIFRQNILYSFLIFPHFYSFCMTLLIGFCHAGFTWKAGREGVTRRACKSFIVALLLMLKSTGGC